jgi:Ca2+-binding EF-hand superfamily protein
MNPLVSSLEKEIRIKIRQKADSYKQEEMLLLRTFKFFDYQGEGKVNFFQFEKVLKRLSVNMFTSNQLQNIFDFYLNSQQQMSSGFRGNYSKEKLDYHIFINKVLGPKRGKSNDVPAFSQREPASLYMDSVMPMGHEEPMHMVSSKEFERALEDLHNGTKRMDMMLILNKINKTLGTRRGQREMDQKEILQVFMQNGLARKHQVRRVSQYIQMLFIKLIKGKLRYYLPVFGPTGYRVNQCGPVPGLRGFPTLSDQTEHHQINVLLHSEKHRIGW